jgi:hypothetical protein
MQLFLYDEKFEQNCLNYCFHSIPAKETTDQREVGICIKIAVPRCWMAERATVLIGSLAAIVSINIILGVRQHVPPTLPVTSQGTPTFTLSR